MPEGIFHPLTCHCRERLTRGLTLDKSVCDRRHRLDNCPQRRELRFSKDNRLGERPVSLMSLNALQPERKCRRSLRRWLRSHGRRWLDGDCWLLFLAVRAFTLDSRRSRVTRHWLSHPHHLMGDVVCLLPIFVSRLIDG